MVDTATAAVPRRAPRRRRLADALGPDWKVAIPFVLPMAAMMVGLILWPFVNAILMSLTAFNFLSGQTVNVGLRNYERLLGDGDYLLTLRNTIRFTFWSLAVKFAAGMAIAIILNSRVPWRGLITTVMLLPWIIPEIVTALAWKSIYDPIFGGLNPILTGLGLIDQPVGWLSQPDTAMASIIAVNVWKGIPFYTLLLLAGLKAIETSQLEAAEVDGASAVQRFRHVTLPGMRYVIVVVLLLSFISTFNQFGLIYLMTGGGPGGATRLYSILAYEKAIASLQYGPGSAVALSVAPLMAVLIWLLARFMRHDGRPARTGFPVGLHRVQRTAARVLGRLLDVLFWPLDQFVRLLSRMSSMALAALPARPGRHVARERRERSAVALRVLALLPIIAFVLFPFYWIVVTALKTTPQISERRSIFWPDPVTLDQFSTLLGQTSFLAWFANSALVAAASTLVSVTFAALAAYALTRLRFAGSGLLTTFILITYLLPATLIFIPLYQTLSSIGLINTYGALILTYPTFLMPFATWVLIGYFRSIPVELEEAAMIDGATRFRAFRTITLPLAAPALLSVTLFAFTNAWNEFLFAFVFTTSASLRTLPVGLQAMVVGDLLPWGQLMAASLLTATPVAALYLYLQRYLVGGLTLGGVKG
jgi:multiple sugar transport system permease protein